MSALDEAADRLADAFRDLVHEAVEVVKVSAAERAAVEFQGAPPAPRSEHDGRFWFTTRQAADYAGRHVQTVTAALGVGDLKGKQTKPGASWRIHREALDEWLGR